jgi:Family of unknown function (DUF6152)
MEVINQMRARFLLPTVAALLTAIPLVAHHSFAAEYDGSALVTLKGVVSKVEWTNPHAYIYVDVKDETGKVTTWGMEGYPPNTLTRTGFTRHIVSEGDTITITGFRARDNATRAAAREVTTSEGKKYNFGPAAQ